MPTPTKGPRLGGSPTHERHMLNNLSAQLFQHKRITNHPDQGKAPASGGRALHHLR